MGPRAGLDRCTKNSPPPGFDPVPSCPERVTVLTELSWPKHMLATHQLYIMFMLLSCSVEMLENNGQRKCTRAQHP